MSLKRETERARAILERGLLSHLVLVLKESIILTALLEAGNLIFGRRAFDLRGVWETFVIAFVGMSILTYFGLLTAAGRYRRTGKKEGPSDNARRPLRHE